MKKTTALMAVLTIALMILTGCGQQESGQAEATEAIPEVKETRVGFYLDTVITLTAYTDHPEWLEEGLQTCGEYEKLLSRTIEGSDVWKLNHAEGQPVTVAEATAEILREAIRIGDLSEGAFDVTIGMMIDLGGIAKGYIADAVKKELEGKGIRSAILSFGGNIVAIGLKPGGTPWRVGIQDIDQPTGVSMLIAENTGGSTVTSGIYERGFEQDGVYYHHILSAETGWPVQNELASVTIFSESSMTGDALATAVFALGSEKGMALIESMDGIEAVLIARDRTVTYSSGAKEYMTE